MQLEDLRVLHLAKNRTQCLPAFAEGIEGVFCLETCQRLLWISSSEHFKSCPIETPGSIYYQGHDAYRFLLRLATGLESEVLGETDVFGQVKEAWRKAESAEKSKVSELNFWIQKLFEDTKEIRNRYLQNLGGSSYGTLIRRLIKDQKGSLDGPILIVGAGQIAQSIGPLLLEDYELWLSNRNAAHLSDFHNQLLKRSPLAVKKIRSREEEMKAWETAAHVVVCIPFDAVQDPERIEWFRKGQIKSRSGNRLVIHLGGMKKHCGNWSQLPQFYCLNDLFKLQNSLGNVRSVQIGYAERACDERSKLRSLGASLSISHGWEDLACFA